MIGKQHFCAIGAHDIKSVQCQHPWHLPFSEWPYALLDRLKQMLPDGPVAGS